MEDFRSAISPGAGSAQPTGRDEDLVVIEGAQTEGGEVTEAVAKLRRIQDVARKARENKPRKSGRPNGASPFGGAEAR